MKILKYILAGLFAIAGLLLIVSAFLPAKVNVLRSTTINAPGASVFEEVNNFKNWDKWSPWKAIDPEMEQTFSENSEGVGAWSSWISKEGNGKQTIVESRANEFIRTQLEFEGWDSEDFSDFNFKDSAESTIVSWSFEGGEMPFYFRLMGIMMTGMIEKEYDNGLANLKILCESKPVGQKLYRGYNITETDMDERVYIAKKDSIGMDKISAFYMENFPKVFEAAGKAKLEFAGSPSGLFFNWDDATKTTVMAAGVEVKGDAQTNVKGFDTFIVPAGKNLFIAYYGAYDKSAEAHYAMDDYMKEKHLQLSNQVIEEYVTDPGQEPDTTKWLTNIYYPVINLK